MDPTDFSECIEVMHQPERFNRATRRAATSRLRRHAKYLRKHVPEDQRNAVQNSFLRIATAL
jgi:hypothetical protein